MSGKKLTVYEENRFILWNHIMTSEVKLGRTSFEVTSRMGNEANSFKEIVSTVTEREIRKANKNAG
jgi:hypothetical protein